MNEEVQNDYKKQNNNSLKKIGGIFLGILSLSIVVALVITINNNNQRKQNVAETYYQGAVKQIDGKNLKRPIKRSLPDRSKQPVLKKLPHSTSEPINRPPYKVNPIETGQDQQKVQICNYLYSNACNNNNDKYYSSICNFAKEVCKPIVPPPTPTPTPTPYPTPKPTPELTREGACPLLVTALCSDEYGKSYSNRNPIKGDELTSCKLAQTVCKDIPGAIPPPILYKSQGVESK